MLCSGSVTGTGLEFLRKFLTNNLALIAFSISTVNLLNKRRCTTPFWHFYYVVIQLRRTCTLTVHFLIIISILRVRLAQRWSDILEVDNIASRVHSLNTSPTFFGTSRTHRPTEMLIWVRFLLRIIESSVDEFDSRRSKPYNRNVLFFVKSLNDNEPRHLVIL